MFIRKICLLFVWVLCSLPVLLAQQPGKTLEVGDPEKLLSGNPFALIAQVDKGSNSIDDFMRSEAQRQFSPADSFDMVVREKRYGYWFKLQVKNLTRHDLYFYMPHYGISTIALYQVRGDSVQAAHACGRIKMSDKTYKTNRTTFEVPLEYGETGTLYLYLEQTNLTRQQFFIGSSPAIVRANHLNDMAHGVYYGFALVIIIYNLLLFYQVREFDHLAFALYITSLAIQMAVIYGYASEFLWPEMPQLMNFSDVILSIGGIIGVWFTTLFLRIKSYSIWLYRIWMAFIPAHILTGIFELLGGLGIYYTFFNVALVTQFQSLLALFSAIYIFFRYRYRYALFYLASQFFLIASVMVFFAFAYGKLEYSFPAYNGMLFGSCLQILTFSIAMSYKVNAYKREKETAEKQKIQLLEEKQEMVSRQNEILEARVTERTSQLETEKKKSDDLLLNILPQEVAEELKQHGRAEARLFDNVTVMFTDFVGFTLVSEDLSPTALVTEIDRCYRAFDDIVTRNGLEKIKTIGDSYLAVCGMPHEDAEHAAKAMRAAIEIRDYMVDYRNNGGIFEIRIGLHSGPVIAGIVGSKKFAYDIWGDTVNTAARMEQNCQPGKINLSEATRVLLADQYALEHRGKIKAKNKGEIDMYYY